MPAITPRYSQRLPDLRYARTFVAIVDTGSFSQAAKQLFMTQPGVTNHLNKLERGLGYRLLERYSRHHVLTPAGARFYRLVQQMLEGMRETLGDIDGDMKQIRGSIRMAAPGSVAGMLLRRLPRLRRHHPQLHFSVQFQPNDAIHRELAAGRLDVGFVTAPDTDTQFVHELLFHDDIVVVAAKKARPARVATLAALAERDFIDYPDRAELMARWLQHHFGRRAHGERLRYSYFVNNLEAVIQLAAAGEGWAAMPAGALDNHSLKRRLAVVRGAKTTAPRQSVYWTLRKDQHLSQRLRVLKEFVGRLS